MSHYQVTFRTLSGGLIGVVVTGLNDGVAVKRMNVAAVTMQKLMPLLNDVRRQFAAQGIVEAK